MSNRTLPFLLRAVVGSAALLLAACSADLIRALPTPGAAAHPDCRSGTFLGSMTLNCPQPAEK